MSSNSEDRGSVGEKGLRRLRRTTEDRHPAARTLRNLLVTICDSPPLLASAAPLLYSANTTEFLPRFSNLLLTRQI